METKKKHQKEKRKMTEILLELFDIFALDVSRWYSCIAIVFSYYIWNKYVQNAEWSDAQKKDYINQQAVFSYNQDAFQKAMDFYNSRQEKLQNGQKFSGRDIFFPEGF